MTVNTFFDTVGISLFFFSIQLLITNDNGQWEGDVGRNDRCGLSSRDATKLILQLRFFLQQLNKDSVQSYSFAANSDINARICKIKLARNAMWSMFVFLN